MTCRLVFTSQAGTRKIPFTQEVYVLSRMQKSNHLPWNVLPWLWYPSTAGRSCAVTFLIVREVVTILLGVSGSLRSVTTRGPHTSASFRRDGRNVTVTLARCTDKIIPFSPTQLTVCGTFNEHGGKQPKSSYIILEPVGTVEFVCSSSLTPCTPMQTST